MRLRDEQKVARHQKKLVKVQEKMSSEEEMKKRKQKLVKRGYSKGCETGFSYFYLILFSVFNTILEKGTKISTGATINESISSKWYEANEWQKS